MEINYKTDKVVSFSQYSTYKSCPHKWYLEYVKGHSGDKQNERVDLIATSYSKGIPLASEVKKSAKSRDCSKDKETNEIQKLFSKNELLEQFA